MLVTRLRAGAAGLLLITVLAACSGGATPSGVATLQSPGAGEADPSASPSASLDPETARLEFARCMREHGIDLPDPGSGGASGPITIGGNGPDVEKMQDAMEACQQFLGDAVGAPAEIDPEMQDKMLEFAKCMRENGVDFADPDFSGGGGRIQIGGPGGIPVIRRVPGGPGGVPGPATGVPSSPARHGPGLQVRAGRRRQRWSDDDVRTEEAD